VTEFLQKLAALKKEREAGRQYRLPTEAEWEYACRGGACSSTPFHHGKSLSSSQANFNGNYPYGGASKGPYLERTCQVGSYRTNAFGLLDVCSNVREWCQDWYAADYYKVSPRSAPSGPSEGSLRVIRGGSWRNLGRGCRSAHRARNSPGLRYNFVGFRVAAAPSE
jgi:formylglycine-generating enzyme required for sulfatase activity